MTGSLHTTEALKVSLTCVALSCIPAAASAQTAMAPAPAQAATVPAPSVSPQSEPVPPEARPLPGQEGSTESSDIIVTATRNSQPLSKVPLSISAFSQEKLDTLGVKTIADIASLTPGVTFTGRRAIAIRGIVSNAGAGTTGIYIDETPVQIYRAGSFVADSVPALFDLDRVEVLRGPQGTLFGSGSMGGTVRYITPQPNLSEYSSYGRAEGSFIDKGGPNYEGGLAIGGPIIEDKLGFRASGYYRRDGGWIDRVDRATGETVDKEANWGESYALRAALTWRPVDAVELTPAIFHQYRFNNSSQIYPISSAVGDATASSWEGFSDPKNGVFRSGARIPQPGKDRSTLYSLTTKVEFGEAQLIANTSYYDKRSHVIADSSVFDSWLLGADGSAGFTTPTGVFLDGFGDWDSFDDVTTTQRSFAQEVRIQSGQEQPFRWVAGVFYERNKQANVQLFHTPSLDIYVGAPVNIRGDVGFYGALRSKNSQIAGFAQVDYDLGDRITLTAGVRKAQLKFSFDSENDGFYNLGRRDVGDGRAKDSPWTPKFGVQFKADSDNLFFANVAKGFRTGGANVPIPVAACAADLASNGFDGAPPSYGPDSVWNYEVGAKNKLLGGRLQLASSAFRVDWSEIQSRLLLPCGFNIVANLGEARSQGFDTQASLRLTDALTLGGNVGYNNAKYTKTLGTTGPLNQVTKGDKLPISPWTATITGDADFELLGRRSYVHAEYRYQSGLPRLIEQNPINTSYDPDYYDRPATNLVYLRAGMRFGGLDASLFANNLFNRHTTIGRANDHIGSPLFIISNLQPRVIGLTLTYRR